MGSQQVRAHLPPPPLCPPALQHLTQPDWAVQPCSLSGKGAFCATVLPLWSLQHSCQVFGTSPRSICLSALQQAQSKLGSVQDAVPPQTWQFYTRTQCQGFLGELPSGYPQVTPPVSLPPAWQGPGALPEAMAIKGPEMEKMGWGGGGAGCFFSLNGIFPSAHAGHACQEVGMGGWMEESSSSSMERVQEAGAHRAPLHLPLLP